MVATLFTRMRLSVTICVHYLPCFFRSTFSSVPMPLYLFRLCFIVILKDLASYMLRGVCDVVSNIACSISECVQRTSDMGAVEAVGHFSPLFYVLKRSGFG
jgi:hypothetical protein